MSNRCSYFIRTVKTGLFLNVFGIIFVVGFNNNNIKINDDDDDDDNNKW